jgi:hypothetical protein
MEPEFDQSFYVLSVVGYLILVEDVLETGEGRDMIKQMFRNALQLGDALNDIPEFRAAMEDIARINAGESVVDATAHRFIPPPPSGTTVAQ